MSFADYLPRSQAAGYIFVECESTSYTLALCERVDLDRALDGHPDAWFTGEDNYGTACRFRVREVVGVTYYTPASLLAAAEDGERRDAAQREYRAIHGLGGEDA